MKVLVIPSSFPNKKNKQASIFVYEQCKELVQSGNEVSVFDTTAFSIGALRDADCWKPRVEKDQYFTIYRYPVPIVLRSLFITYGELACYIHVKKLFKLYVKQNGMPDIIYQHFTYPQGRVVRHLSKKYNIPFVVEEHGGMYFDEKLNKKYVKNLRKTYDKASAFITVSQALKNRIIQLTGIGKKIFVIPNMIDRLFKFHPLSHSDKFVFFSAGNLVSSKRFDLLIKAFDYVFHDDNNCTLLIAGDGKERSKLQQYISSQNITNIKLLGRIGREEMLSQYINCNAFVLLSEHESFGIVYREALAVGRPIVSTNNQGVAEDWNEKDGIMIKIDDFEEACQALKRIKTEYSKYDLEDISERCLKKYSCSSVVPNINEVLSNAAHNK